MNTLPTDILKKLIDAKHQCLLQLHELGKTQRGLIESNAMSQLLELLTTKQHVLTRMQAVEKKLDHFRTEDPEKRIWNSPEDRQQCAAVSADCKKILSEIIAMEKENEATMVIRRDDAATQLHTAHAANRARAAYSTHSTS